MTVLTGGSSDSYSTFALVRRLLVSEALTHWPRYAVAFTLMGVAAAGTALSAYLLGKMTNEAYVDRNFHGIVVVAVVAMAIFAIKGMASYGATVMLSASSPTAIRPNSLPGSPPAPMPSAR